MLKMRPLTLIIIALLSVSCSTKKATTTKPKVEMQIQDIVDLLEKRAPNLRDKELYNNSDKVFLLQMNKSEYEIFAERFTEDVKILSKTKFSYYCHHRSIAEYDEKLSYFSLSLGAEEYYDTFITASLDTVNERVLLRIFKSKD